MNFANAAYNGQRGVAGDTYREWIDVDDRQVTIDLANRMRSAVLAAHGKTYTVQTSYALYPTSGTSTDYMWSRHRKDPSKPRIRSYTIEWGTSFQPSYDPTMVRIIDEIVAGLVELCLGVLDTHADAVIRDTLADTGSQPATGAFWESPDLIVRRTDDDVLTHEAPVRNKEAYLYVRVWNQGPATARKLKVKARATRFAGTEFVFPGDWAVVDATHLAPTPVTDEFAMVPPGASRVAKFLFSKTQVDALWDWQQAQYHPCLLAAVDGVDDYRSPAGPHVWENNNLGQRNISVAKVSAGAKAQFLFAAGNVFNRDKALALVVDRQGLSATVPMHLERVPAPERIPSDDRAWDRDPADGDDVLEASLVEGAVFDLRVGGTALRARLAPRSSIRVLTEKAAVRHCVGATTGNGGGPDDVVVILEEPTARVELDRRPGELQWYMLSFDIPVDAELDDVYRVQIAQHDQRDRAVGGVTLEARVADLRDATIG